MLINQGAITNQTLRYHVGTGLFASEKKVSKWQKFEDFNVRCRSYRDIFVFCYRAKLSAEFVFCLINKKLSVLWLRILCILVLCS